MAADIRYRGINRGVLRTAINAACKILPTPRQTLCSFSPPLFVLYLILALSLSLLPPSHLRIEFIQLIKDNSAFFPNRATGLPFLFSSLPPFSLWLLFSLTLFS